MKPGKGSDHPTQNTNPEVSTNVYPSGSGFQPLLAQVQDDRYKMGDISRKLIPGP